MSDRKAQAIYEAVHDEIVQLRIRTIQVMRSGGYTPDELDVRIAEAGQKAGDAAVAAYRKPLKSKAKR